MITPIFKLDSDERWWPQPVETVEQLGTINTQPIDLLALPKPPPQVDPPPVMRMDFPDGMQDPRDTPRVGYHRVVSKANLFWHQFWLWYLYNPWPFEPLPGRHEGDWEFVQIATADEEGNRPVLMTASQHKQGQKKEFWRCEREGERPVIYVALGSHANFFTPGYRPPDEADGGGEVLDDIEWRPFDDAWATWVGKWGHSDGRGGSPDSPGRQSERWYEPQDFHGRSR